MEQTDQSTEEKLIPLEGEEASVPQCEEMSVGAQETKDSKFLGSGLAGDEEEDSIFDTAAAAGDDAVREEVMEVAAEEAEPSADVTRSGGKRKRGRPPRAQSVRPPAKKKGEEDVCFICFDGGNLVVCDRRGCPKVYHPACVNRDEAFFQSRGRWNCGWHICSICEKAAHYMCYTCTYSLCKGCIKEAGFVCVRGNKGFCETCYSTVMLIESKEHANEGKIGVDFDDKNSFEYLFKDYWFILKGKLSLTLEELNSAKSPWKRSAGSAHNEESSDDLYNANDDQGASSDSSSGRREGSTSSRKKVRRRPRATAAEESCVLQVDSEGASMPEDTEWASKELLEFVAHMKGGDKSVLSQFDVQALLLEYIKQNNLRDPRRKSQIICDPRLENLFGKARVGHFEMLKLLESHFLIKEASQVVTDDNQGGVLDPDSGQMDAEGYSDAATKMSSDKRRKNRKKVEEREPQTNLDDYAAIDVHNISLIYLRRNLMEDFLDDVDSFNEKVVGSFVRIRISGMGQRQDMYRLVQVVGTPKAAEKYKTGRKTTDFTLEILNLNKMEVITIDSISNQEFTEEECKRLRQSIKCGLISRLTVGDVQEKARVFQAVRVNDWLESEKLRLGHLRDRASEKGRRKELRECVEKLQLLSTPEERRRRLNEVPEIHVDPNMDPDYESADEGESDDKNQDNFSRSREPSSLRKGREGISPGRGGSTSSNNWGGARKSSSTTWESNRNTFTEGARDKAEAFTSVGDRTNEPSWNQGKDVRQTNTWETPTNLSNATGLEAGVWNNNQPAIEFEQSYGVAPETMTSLPSDTSEHEKIWHYKDPSGKIQGPFSMTQLRKWSTTGYFPDDLRIWRVSEKQEDSILLPDALIGKFEKDLPQWEPPQSNFSQPTTFAAGMDSRANEREGGWRGKNNPAFVDSKQNRGNRSETVNTELPNADRLASHSSTWSAPRTEMVDPREVISGISPRGWEPSRDTRAWSGQPQAHSSPRPTAPFSGNPYGPTSYQGSGGLGGGNVGRWNRGQDRRSNWSSSSPRASLPSGQGYDMQHSNWGSPGQQSSRPQWGNDSFNLPTPTPQPSSGGWTSAQGAMNTPASPTPVQHMGSGWATPPSTVINGTHKSPAATMEHGGWGSNSSSMPNMANQMAETNAAQVPQRVDGLGESLTSNQQTEAPNVLESHSAVVPRDEVIPSCNPTVLGGSSRNEFSVGICKNQFFDSDCPSPTPRSERQELAAVQSSELDPGKKWPEANDSRRSDPAFAVPALEISDPPASYRPENDNLKSVFSTSSEDVQNLPNSRSLSSETQDNLSPIRDTQDKPIHPVLNTKPTAESSALEAASTRSSEGLAPSSAQKQDPNGWSHSPAPSGHEWEQNQTQKPKPSLARPEPMKTGNLEGTPDAIRGDEWSLPSPTPTTKPSGWNACADPSSGISQNNPWVSSDGSRPPESSQLHAGTPIELAQPSQPGWGTGAKDASSSGWGVSPQNLNSGAGSAQGNPNTGWGSVIQGSTDAGLGTIAQGNVNVAWGTAAQGNANLNAGWGTPAVQGSTNPNTGWGTPQQVNPNPNTGWGTPAQGKTHPNAGWGMPSQGNINPSTGWGTPSQGNTNPNAGWGAAAQGDATNPGWGQPTPENSNPNSGWGTAIQQNASWGTGQGNTNGWESRQNRSGDRYGGSHGGDSRYDSRHGGGRNQRNDKMHRDREGGASRPPLRGGGQGQGGQRGVCKFHESGYCKKGASCNYLHS